MSLSSKELNYLIWRYLEESGYDLSAYAFDKQSKSSEYEDEKSKELLSKIEPGFLVSLVQKGILYSLAESDVTQQKPKPEILTFFGSLLQQERDNAVDIKDAQMELDGDGSSHHENNNNASKSHNGQKSGEEFTTKRIESTITYDESLISRWHPSMNVLAYIKTDSSLSISVIGEDGQISETATLKSLGPDNVKDLTSVSWSPLGNLITTANTAGDLCSWSPDGHLRNVVRGTIKPQETKGVIMDIEWSPNGQYFLTNDTNGKILLWNGTNLDIIDDVNGEGSSGAISWLDDHKFAVSAKDAVVKVVSVDDDSTVKTIGELRGHTGAVTNLAFHQNSRCLASYSHTDNMIKLWHSSSSTSSEGTTLSSRSRILPLILLKWLENGHLLSVSLNGVIRVWDGETEYTHVNIFKDNSAYNFEDSALSITRGPGSILYAADLSDGHLALGDNHGRVSIWNVDDKLTCRQVFDAEGLGDDETKGISSISWDKSGEFVSVSYNGISSVVLKVAHKEVK